MAWLNKKLRVNPETGRRAAYYSVSWRESGRVRSRGLGYLDPSQARKAKAHLQLLLDAGLPLPEATPSPERSSQVPTVREYLYDEYLPVLKRDKARSTYQHARTYSKALTAFMGEVALDEVSFRLVDRYITWRCRTVRTRTAQLDVRLLRSALRRAKQAGTIEVVPDLPTVKITDKKPHVWLTEEETVRLLEAARPLDDQPEVTRGRPPVNRDRLSYLAISMAVNLGMRRGEILSRGWEDLDWTRAHHGVLRIDAKPAASFQVKTRRPRVIPLTPELARHLRQERTRVGSPDRGWIFPSPKDPTRPRQNFIKALKRACKTAGLPPIHPHALRHTWASRLAMAGVDRQSLMVLGGWRDGRMLDEVYAHVSDDHVADVMSRMGVQAPQESA